MYGRQGAVDGQRDGLGKQTAGDERPEDVVVDVGRAYPHLGHQPVGPFRRPALAAALAAPGGVVAPRVDRRCGLRRRDLGPRVMRGGR